MTSNNIELVQLSSDYESVLRRQVIDISTQVSGSIPSGHKQFVSDVPIIREKALFQIYTKIESNDWIIADSSNILIDVVWDHNVYLWLSQPSVNLLRITIDVDNPSAAHVILTQNIFFKIRVFDVPFS